VSCEPELGPGNKSISLYFSPPLSPLLARAPSQSCQLWAAPRQTSPLQHSGPLPGHFLSAAFPINWRPRVALFSRSLFPPLGRFLSHSSLGRPANGPHLHPPAASRWRILSSNPLIMKTGRTRAALVASAAPPDRLSSGGVAGVAESLRGETVVQRRARPARVRRRGRIPDARRSLCVRAGLRERRECARGLRAAAGRALLASGPLALVCGFFQGTTCAWPAAKEHFSKPPQLGPNLGRPMYRND